MYYDPIKLEVNKSGIDFYFIRKNGEQWFYQIHSLHTKKDAEWWDNHLKNKMWYVPELRERVLKAMDNFLKLK
jgi:hypothetical protein